MAVIDRDQLVSDVILWLPPENALSEAQILALAEEVISNVGDDDIYYKEVRCKTLQSAGMANKSFGATGNSLRREESNKREVEYFNNNIAKEWDDWLRKLPDLCTQLGYCDLYSSGSMGFYANVSPPINVPDCEVSTNLTINGFTFK